MRPWPVLWRAIRKGLRACARGLPANRLSSPLYDVARFARSIEAAYLRMMEISRQGRQTGKLYRTGLIRLPRRPVFVSIR